jgi:hypothetical protein
MRQRRGILKASVGRVRKSNGKSNSFLINKNKTLGSSTNATIQLTRDTLRVS